MAAEVRVSQGLAGQGSRGLSSGDKGQLWQSGRSPFWGRNIKFRAGPGLAGLKRSKVAVGAAGGAQGRGVWASLGAQAGVHCSLPGLPHTCPARLKPQSAAGSLKPGSSPGTGQGSHPWFLQDKGEVL